MAPYKLRPHMFLDHQQNQWILKDRRWGFVFFPIYRSRQNLMNTQLKHIVDRVHVNVLD